MNRSVLINLLAERIARINVTHSVRVAIDGVDGVGKTTFAEELVVPVKSHGRPVIRASIEGFHNPRAVRYRLGRYSPEGNFRDSFDYAALIGVLLAPLGPGGARSIRRAVFDYRIDFEAMASFETAAPDAVLLFDGVFLLRPGLRSYWDFAVLLDAPFAVTVARGTHRDRDVADVDVLWKRRYVEGQKLYFQRCEPKGFAAIAVNNENLAAPEIAFDSGISQSTG